MPIFSLERKPRFECLPISAHATTLTHAQPNFLLLPGWGKEGWRGAIVSLPSTSRVQKFGALNIIAFQGGVVHLLHDNLLLPSYSYVPGSHFLRSTDQHHPLHEGSMKRICNRGSISVLRILSLLSLFVSFNCSSDTTGCFGEDSSRMDDVLRDNSSREVCVC